MCPKRPMSPPIVSDTVFDPILYKLFTNFRLAGITPDQLAPAQRTRYAIFLDVCRSFPVAATMEMPLLATAEMVITSCAYRGDDGRILPGSNGISDAARLFYSLKNDNMMSPQFDQDLAKDWSTLLLNAEKDFKSDVVEIYGSSDQPEEQPCCSNSAVDVNQNESKNAKTINGCHDPSKASADEHIAGAAGGQQDEIDI